MFRLEPQVSTLSPLNDPLLDYSVDVNSKCFSMQQHHATVIDPSCTSMNMVVLKVPKCLHLHLTSYVLLSSCNDEEYMFHIFYQLLVGTAPQDIRKRGFCYRVFKMHQCFSMKLFGKLKASRLSHIVALYQPQVILIKLIGLGLSYIALYQSCIMQIINHNNQPLPHLHWQNAFRTHVRLRTCTFIASVIELGGQEVAGERG